jgi:hypothetical protein
MRVDPSRRSSGDSSGIVATTEAAAWTTTLARSGAGVQCVATSRRRNAIAASAFTATPPRSDLVGSLA